MNSKQIIDTVGIHVERYLYYINRVLNLFTNLIQLFTEEGSVYLIKSISTPGKARLNWLIIDF